MLVLDFLWHRNGWASYSWNRDTFPDGEELYASLADGSSAYGAPVKLILNHHPGSEAAPVHEISPDNEDRYDTFAREMGADPAANLSFGCNFYDAKYVRALHRALLTPLADWPWFDCITCRAASLKPFDRQMVALLPTTLQDARGREGR